MTELLTLAGALVFGSLTFWCFWVGLFLVFCLMVGLTETEHWGWAMFTTVLGFLALGVTGIFNIYQYTTGHPWGLAKLILEYVVIGLIWGGVKWWRFVKKAKATYLEARDKFLTDNNARELTDELRIKWTAKLQERSSSMYSSYDGETTRVDGQAPLAKNHKETIIVWMSFWPWSMLGTIFYDFLREVWEMLYDAVAGVYDSISKSVFNDISGDIVTPEQAAAIKEAVAAKKAADKAPKTGPTLD